MNFLHGVSQATHVEGKQFLELLEVILGVKKDNEFTVLHHVIQHCTKQCCNLIVIHLERLETVSMLKIKSLFTQAFSYCVSAVLKVRAISVLD